MKVNAKPYMHAKPSLLQTGDGLYGIFWIYLISWKEKETQDMGWVKTIKYKW